MVFAFDLDAVLALQRLAGSSAIATTLTIFCARWAIFLNLPLAGYLLYTKRAKARHAVAEALWTTGLSLLLVSILSRALKRPRPFLASDLVSPLIPPPYNMSFPSGHTAAAVSIALALFLADETVGWLSFGLAALTAFGRMAAGVHYPTDILGGAGIGLTAFFVVRRVHAGLRTRDIERAAKKHHHDA